MYIYLPCITCIIEGLTDEKIYIRVYFLGLYHHYMTGFNNLQYYIQTNKHPINRSILKHGKFSSEKSTNNIKLECK